MSAPPNISDLTMQKTTRDYQKRQIRGHTWQTHMKSFYKTTRQMGFTHVDTLKQVSSIYKSGR